jgi:hypothetical protein
MSGPIPVMPLDTLREKVGLLIEEAKTRALPMSTLTLLSIGEYLKDAERWNYAMTHEIPVGMSANETRKWVDQQLQEVEDGVERVVRARQRRVDGVSGDSGAGGTPDPVVRGRQRQGAT